MQSILLRICSNLTFNVFLELIKICMNCCNSLLSCVGQHISQILFFFLVTFINSILDSSSITSHSLSCSILWIWSLILSQYFTKVFLTFSYWGAEPLFICCCVCSQMQVAQSPTRQSAILVSPYNQHRS